MPHPAVDPAPLQSALRAFLEASPAPETPPSFARLVRSAWYLAAQLRAHRPGNAPSPATDLEAGRFSVVAAGWLLAFLEARTAAEMASVLPLAVASRD